MWGWKRTGKSNSRKLFLESLEDRSLMAAVTSGFDTQKVLPTSSAGSSTVAAALVDDGYEQNDTLGTARGLGTITSPRTLGGLVMADANDFYRFTLSRRPGTSDTVSIGFQNSQGDLDLALYNIYGQRVRYAGTTNSGEQVSLGGLAAGQYYIRVYGYQAATNPSYSLSVNVGGAALADDAYENNDTFGTARDLGTLTSLRTITNLVMADGHDWYRFSMSGAGSSSDFVGLSFQNTQGNLALELYNSSGTRLAAGNGLTDSERISLANRAAGTYYVHVLGVSGARNPSYSLQVDPGTITTTPAPTSGAFDVQLRFSGLSSTQQAIFQQAAARWESIIVGDLPNATHNGLAVDDLLIEARGVYIDGRGGILGQAGPDRFRSSSGLPYHGVMEFDTADLSAMQSNGTLLGVIMHEMGHVLGIGTLWSSKGLLVGASTSNPRFIGAQAVAAYNAIFGASSTGVPVEAGGGAGTRNSHWRESIFGTELMTGWVGPGSNMPISRITVGSLADIGYSVSFAAASTFSPSIAASAALVSGTTQTSTLRTAQAAATASPAGLASSQPIHRNLLSPWTARSRSLQLDDALSSQSQRSREAATDALLANWSPLLG
jgi:hypothetical protein